ncbi:hypothetical protein KBTX_02779 [wastewater metagenome]|uniref:Uncharacterized protein n=2 Tax=unclassified sequences TaxID=12908 RepID=A0A5B8RCX7_9ZZZZ|nr:hypothetical protein [Arhodomonas sp. KWT]QEA06441.1 hypothetical protein KBTEX_02779 [uncultured organism]
MSVLDTSRWRPEFRALPERDFVAGFITDMETEGDRLGAQRLQGALSDDRLEPALNRPFGQAARPGKWPLRFAVSFLLPFCQRPEFRAFVRVDNETVSGAFEDVAKLARRLERALGHLESVAWNTEALPLDEVMPGGDRVNLRGGVLTSALPALALEADAQAARRRYRGHLIDSSPGTYERDRIVAEIDNTVRTLFERAMTKPAIAATVTAVLSREVTPDDVSNVRRKIRPRRLAK